MDLPPPPAALEDLVHALCRHERGDSWSRYATSPLGEPHHPGEVSVPLVALQSKLESGNQAATYSIDDPDNYENVLYEEWFSVARHLGNIE
jgi:hypothetical protein